MPSNSLYNYRSLPAPSTAPPTPAPLYYPSTSTPSIYYPESPALPQYYPDSTPRHCTTSYSEHCDTTYQLTCPKASMEGLTNKTMMEACPPGEKEVLLAPSS